MRPSLIRDAAIECRQRRRRLAGSGEGRDRVHGRRRGRRAHAGRTWCWSGSSPRPTTWRASLRPRASSRPRAARPPTRRSWQGGWASRAWRRIPRRRSTSRARSAPRRPRLREGDLITIDGTTGRVTTDDVPLIEPQLDQRFDRAQVGRRVRASSGSVRTRTRPRRRAGHATSVRRASACAAPSTCSWSPIASRGCADDPRPATACPPQGARRAVAASAARLRGALPGDGGPAGDDPPARSAAARVPAEDGGAGVELERGRQGGPATRAGSSAADRGRQLEETNPMLGTRGCRLGIVPGDLRHAGRAIIGAALRVRERTGAPRRSRS